MKDIETLSRKVAGTLQRAQARTGTSPGAEPEVRHPKSSIERVLESQRAACGALAREVERASSRRRDLEEACERAEILLDQLGQQSDIIALRIQYTRRRRDDLRRRAEGYRLILARIAEERRDSARAVLHARNTLERITDRLNFRE